MSRIIEFMGLPGSGKSTLTHVLLEDLHRRGSTLLSNEEAVIRCIRRRDDGMVWNFLKRLPYIVWEPAAGSRHAMAELHLFSSAYLPLFGLMFEVLNRRPIPTALQQCILYAYYLHCAERYLLDTYLVAGEGVVVEEGLAMGLLAILGCLLPGSPCKQDIARYVSHMPAPFAIFWVDASPTECVKRLRMRPQMPLPWVECSDRELLENLEYNHHILDIAASELTDRGIPVHRIPNSEWDTEAARRLVCEQGGEWAWKMLNQ
jgi:hypothetical protein